jgi:murein L,D-transpeptidase YcbB/YkuD
LPDGRTQHLSDKGAAELRTMLNVAKLAALSSERLTVFADQAAELYASMDRSLLWIERGRPTAQALEVLAAHPSEPIARRVVQLELTLERWRWLPSPFARPPIVVNIPEFRLHVVDEQHHIVSSMNIVVGRAYRHATPLFESEIRFVLFRPPWNVPLEIQRNELVPLLDKDPSYLAENSYDVVDARGNRIEEPSPTEETISALRNGRLFLRQRPGEENSLGLVRFELPNLYDVYLHGTPAQELFSKSRRDFSHGCVRVEDPVALAVWLLRENPGWNEERIKMSMHGYETLRVVLSRPVPIWIVYGTAVVLEDGRVRFFDDIYGQDAALERELSRTKAETSARE